MVVPQIGKHRVLYGLAVVGFSVGIPVAAADDGAHTFDGKHPIGTINLTVVYLVPKDQTPLADWRDLFTALTAIPHPIVPAPNEQVSLRFTWPVDAKLRKIKVRVQTDFHGPWQTVPHHVGNEPPDELPIGDSDRPTPISYRVDAVLEDGQSVELWGSFQVKP